MISIYAGRIGGGKTYSAVLYILERIAQGGTVFTNIDMNPAGVAGYLRKRYLLKFNSEQLIPLLPEQIFRFPDHIKWGTVDCPSLVVIDEAQLFFNSRNWAKLQKENPELLTFLSQSRKMNVDVVFITQEITNIDKQFRLLAQEHWTFRDMQKIRIPWIGKWPLPQIRQVCADYTGEVMQITAVMKRKDVFAAYDTAAFLDAETMRLAQEKRTEAIKARQVEALSEHQKWLVRIGLHGILERDNRWNPFYRKCLRFYVRRKRKHRKKGKK